MKYGPLDIVLPCYNASEWVDKFIEDLLPSVDIQWRLIARDDGSTDETYFILNRWKNQLGPRMILLDDDGPRRNLGLIGNYNSVLAASSAPWILTADPDDVWLPSHVGLTLDALKGAEATAGAETPIAVCTDAEVVDSSLNRIAPSFWRWSRNRPRLRDSVAGIAMDSVALGSTMAVNRALLQVALPIPAAAAYQDWWLALVATSLGRFVALPDVTIRYRRHDSNATKDPFSTNLTDAFGRVLRTPLSAKRRLDFLIRQAAKQAGAFVDIYGGRMTDRDQRALRALAQLPDLDPLKRRLVILRYGLWFNSAAKNAAMLLMV